MMNRIAGCVGGFLAAVVMAGCSTTPAPEGFHYETCTVGKHPERRVVKDRESEDNVVKVTSTVPTGPLEPGAGDHYEYQYRGKYTSKVVVKDVDVNGVPVEYIEVSADQRCPKCHWDYVLVGKRSVVKWYCAAKVHPSKEEAQKTAPPTP
jgi:hypothetical protein